MFYYCKEKNGLYYVYERGGIYIKNQITKVNRMFKGYDFKPVRFPNKRGCVDFCNTKNEIEKLY